MTVYYDQERAVWRFDFWRNRKRHHGYCIHPTTKKPAENKTQAREIETLLKAAAIAAPPPASQADQVPAPALVDTSYRLAQGAIAYATTVKHKSSWPTVAGHIEELLTWFGPDRPLDEIHRSGAKGMSAYVAWSLEQPVLVWVGGPYKRDAQRKRAGDRPLWKDTGARRDARTVNRHLDTLRSILHLAHGTIDPATRRPLLAALPEIPYLDVDEDTPRPFGLATLKTLIDGAPQHLAETILVCLIFGFRLRQGLYAEASRVDLELRGYWLPARSRGNKGRRGAFVPFGPETHDFVAALVARARATGVDRLIQYARRRRQKDGSVAVEWTAINSVSTSWSRLLERHGLKGLHTFHNTKTTLISNIADLAADAVVQDLAQHRDLKTTRKHYIAIGDDPKRRALTEFEQRLAGAGIAIGDRTPAAVLPARARPPVSPSRASGKRASRR